MKKKPNEKARNTPIEADKIDQRKEIELRAYFLWLANGRGHGSDLNHWLQAEKEVDAGGAQSARP